MNERLTEEKVLNCLMVDEHSSYFDKIDEGDFFHPESKRLFQVLLKINDTGKNIDVGQVVDDYSYLVGSDDVGFNYVQGVLDCQATTANIDHSIDQLQDISKKRQLKHICAIALEGIQDSRADLSEILQEAERGINEISKQKEDSAVKTSKEAIKGALHAVQGIIRGDVAMIGHSTGLRNLDEFLSLRGGEMVVIGARPSIGKSALAGALARNLSDSGVNVYLGTLEMKAEDFMQRLLFTEMGTNQYKVKDLSRSELEGRLIKATDKLSNASIWFDDVGRDWAGIKRRIRRAVRNVGVQVAMIDYLQLIQIKGTFFSRENQVATISGEIKALALELNITIIILAQLNREAEGKTPSMRDLRESGAIEQDADIVALLSREREGESDQAERIEATLHVVKYRNGRTGKADLWFVPGLTNFIDRVPTMLLPNEWEKE